MYEYSKLRPELFKEENQAKFLKLFEAVLRLLRTNGAIVLDRAHREAGSPFSDSWLMLAAFDRLEELGYIKNITPPGTWGQDRVYIKG